MPDSRPEEEASLFRGSSSYSLISSSPSSPTSPLAPTLSPSIPYRSSHHSPNLPLSQPSFNTPKSRLNARKTSGLSEKSKGKQRAVNASEEDGGGKGAGETDDLDNIARYEAAAPGSTHDTTKARSPGRHVTVVFSNESESGGGNLELWIEDGESVGSVKEQIRHLRPSLAPLSLRLIHAGRLLTDGILLLPWLQSLEDRVRRQAGGVGGDVESVLKDVGFQDDEPERETERKGSAGETTASRLRSRSRGPRGHASPERKIRDKERVWLHCNVGGRLDEDKDKEKEDGEETTPAPRRRGFDVLLDAGLSPADVANMRRQFYESRGEEVPEGMDLGDVNDEHARALEEQWIEGDLTAETATTTSEGMYTSILHGLLTGFLFPLIPWFFFRELPLPNFFDADAEARGEDDTTVSGRVSNNPDIGGEFLPSVVFGKRMQMGILLGTFINVAFGWLRFLN
ncbi:hypothetical protein BD324DRAFT_650838 [Kockovaella imperatae]|uniref:Ubiquitin-like domain-containing protein n=1 Tax=Kockovaella imperatae TaxID=4999 RepID=A0A1Y1UGT2_9TREE|nr:hypothetical protein BD324DRAFT_650838 [Kockovaella imperatae]ORX37232.1 hypothetical protein BD324DRAFT_650838 [Kockovaella imperatae]